MDYEVSLKSRKLITFKGVTNFMNEGDLLFFYDESKVLGIIRISEIEYVELVES